MFSMVGGAMKCEGCPFNDGLTELASEAQNWGCLPSASDVINVKRATGHNWACHADEKKMCDGLKSACHSLNLKTDGRLVSYAKWYQTGDVEKSLI